MTISLKTKNSVYQLKLKINKGLNAGRLKLVKQQNNKNNDDTLKDNIHTNKNSTVKFLHPVG